MSGTRGYTCMYTRSSYPLVALDACECDGLLPGKSQKSPRSLHHEAPQAVSVQ